ncbi:MAG: hypothetical protein ACI865_001971 [Flavobacteriaceae bacterium]|jgi:hypothetical protein
MKNGVENGCFASDQKTLYAIYYARCGFTLINERTGEEQWYEQTMPICGN